MDSIRRIVHVLRVSSRQAERRVGLSGAQLFVLQRLKASESLSINDLAQRTSTHQSSVSVVVRRLVELNLVHRVTDPADARRIELSLTPTGQRLIRRAPNAAQDRLLAAVDQLPPPQARKLADLLHELVARLESTARPAPKIPGMFFEDRRNHKTRTQELLNHL